MRKFLYISSLLFATLLLLVFAVVEHHHHADGAPCICIHQCEQAHDEPCDESHNHNGNESCPITANYIISEGSHTDSRCKVDGCAVNHNDTHLHTPSFILTALTNIVPPVEECYTFKYGDNITPGYQSSTPLAVGLRAPPIA